MTDTRRKRIKYSRKKGLMKDTRRKRIKYSRNKRKNEGC